MDYIREDASLSKTRNQVNIYFLVDVNKIIDYS